MDKEINLILLFGLYPKEKYNEILNCSKMNVQNAANNLQWNIVNGLELHRSNKINIKIVNSMYIPSFPKGFTKYIVKTSKFNHIKGAEDINVGFINISVINEISRTLSLRKYLRKSIDRSKRNIVLIYALTTPFMESARYLKKVFLDRVEICAVVPDLPKYMYTDNKSRNILRNLIRKVHIRIAEKDYKYIDKYIVLAEEMKKSLKTNKYIVIEGISVRNENYIEYNVNNTKKKKCIIYAGTLNERYGIISLIRAFSYLEVDLYELHIFGNGDSVEKIKRACNKANNIYFHGLIAKETLYKYYNNADAFVNPRKNNEEYVKYSFPSKVLEYLSFGIPVVSYKLPGIPKEYYEYLFFPEDDSDLALAIEIKRVCNLSKDARNDYYKKTINFINKKDKYNQCKKMIEFIIS